MLRLHWRRVRAKYPWLQMLQTWRAWLLISFIIVLITYTVLSYHKRPVALTEQEIKEVWLGNIQIDFRTGLFSLKIKDTVYLRGSVPDSQQMQQSPSYCGKYNASETLCAEWYPYTRLEVTFSSDEHATCESFKWTTIDRTYGSRYRPQTCFSLADFHWYGGSLLSKQTWPLNKATVPLQQYVTHDLKSYQGPTTVFGNVQDWFWINSAGVAVMMDSTVPVQVSVNQSNDKLLCFHSMSDGSPALRYLICKAGNIKKIHRYVMSKMVHLPTSLPSEGYFSKPLWSSFPMLKYPTQTNILKYAQEVSEQQFGRYSLELYDETVSLFKPDFFDKKRYPNLQMMMMLLRGDYSIAPTVSISPYVMTNENLDKSKLLQDMWGKSIVTKRNGVEWNMLNLLDSSVLKEFILNAKGLQDLCGLNRSIWLIRGESEYLPQEVLSISRRNTYTEKFLSIASDLKLTVLSTFAVNSQKYSGLLLLSSSASSWDGDGGLTSLISSVLTLGMLGYPFVIPNVVGGPGNASEVNATYTHTIPPDKELYIRWMGVAAYMPVMMFSFPPWLYGQEVVDMAHAFEKIHTEIVSPLVIKAAREYEISGSPIVRPIWWIDPTDKILETIDDEYLIGDSLLVCPLLRAGEDTRDIYIPNGRWHDDLNSRELDGKKWLKSFKIPLDQVATFSKVAF